MKKWKEWFSKIAFCYVCIATQTLSFAEDGQARIVRSKNESEKISNLSFDQEDNLSVLSGEVCRNALAPTGGYCFELIGTYSSSDAVLSIYNKRGRIILNPKKAAKNRFKVKVPLLGKAGWVQFLEVNARGNRKVENIKAFASGMEIDPTKGRVKEKSSITLPGIYRNQLGLGTSYSNIIYKQTGKTSAADSTLSVITTKLDYRRKIGQTNRFSWGLNTFVTAYPISTTRTDGVAVRFVGANWRMGSFLLNPANRFNIELMAGGYYHSMLVTNKAFGFEHAMGPQILSRMKFDFSPSQISAIYGKWALLPQGWIPSNFSDAEIATGLNHAIIFKSRHSIVFSFDFATLKYAIGSVNVTSQSLSGGIGYGIAF